MGLGVAGLGLVLLVLALAPWWPAREPMAAPSPVLRVEPAEPAVVSPRPLPDDRPMGTVRGRVLEPDGSPADAVAKLDAGQGVFAASTRRDGSFVLQAPVGTHVLFATVLVGEDEVLGPPVLVQVTEGGLDGVELAVPPEHTVGIGLVLDLREEGVVVTWAQEGKAAEAAGVRSGDVLVSVDGVSLATAGLLDAERALQGTVGSVVRLGVERAGEGAKEVVVVRR